MSDNPYLPPDADLSAQRAEGEGGHTATMARYLSETRPWVRFLGILGFIVAGLMIIGGLGMAAVMANEGSLADSVGGALFGVFYIAFGAIYVFPSLMLHRYANAIVRMDNGGGTEAVEEALLHQRSFWRTVGIMTLVGMLLWLVAMVIVAVAGVAATFGKL